MHDLLSKFTGSRDNNFNLLRFIAATMVLYSHSFAIVIDPSAEPLRATFGVTWGEIAVDLFFVTSGFLIAGSFFHRGNLGAFTWARVLRIYPAMFIATLATVFVSGLYFTTLSVSEYLASSEIYQHLVKNCLLVFGVEYRLPGVFMDNNMQGTTNGSLWTLPFELLMYGLLAGIGTAVLWFQKKINRDCLRQIFLLVAIVGVCANIVNHFIPLTGGKGTPIRLFAMFFVGSAFYLYRDKILISTKIVVPMVAALFLSTVNKDLFFLVYSFTIPYIVFCLAYAPSGALKKFNNIGDYSYGMYIYAWPVQQAISATVPNVSVFTMVVGSFAITLVLAFLSWNLVEKRTLKWKNKYDSLVLFLANRNARVNQVGHKSTEDAQDESQSVVKAGVQS